MLYFIVPLRSRKSSLNWDKVVHDFNLTLKSIMNQLDPYFRVVVACTDIPDYPADERLQIIVVPVNYQGIGDAMRDKGNKMRAMCAHIRAQGGGYIMPVDADDLISNRISALVNQAKSKAGYIAGTGYEYDDKSKRIRLMPKFYNLCGTCCVMHFTAEELPENMEDKRYYTILAGHTHWKSEFEKKNTPLQPFPFKPVVYRINTGENDSIRTNNIGFKRKVIRFVWRGFPVSKKIREEFSLCEQ